MTSAIATKLSTYAHLLAMVYIRQHGQIKRSEAMELCRLTEGQVKRLLQKMLAAKQIVMRGHGKKTAYVEPQ